MGGRLTHIVVRGLATRTNEHVEATDLGSCQSNAEPPVVTITAPAANSAVVGETVIRADVTGSTRPRRVSFQIDGQTVFSDTSAPFEMPWSVRSLADGQVVQISVVAEFKDRDPVTARPVQVVVSDKPPGWTVPTVVSLTFDDSLQNEMTAADVMNRHGLHGTFYVISGRLGATRYMNWDDIDRLVAEGHEIGGHTRQHLPLTTLEPDEQMRQICDDRRALLAHGYEVRSFSFPLGRVDTSAKQAAASCGYESARSTTGIGPSTVFAETTPPQDPYSIRAVTSFLATDSLADFQRDVRKAEAGGGWVVVTFHAICPDVCDYMAVSPDEFELFASWLAARADEGTVVRTVGSVIGGPTRPVPNSPVPIRDPGPSLINGGFEEADPLVPGGARCWTLEPKKSSFGTPSDAASVGITPGMVHGGLRSAQVTIPGTYPGVIVELESRLDLGGCSPRSVPGTRYVGTIWHTGDSDATLRMLYVNDAGRLVFLKGAVSLPHTTYWTSDSVATPPMPAEARFLILRVEVTSPGTVAFDDAALRAIGP